MYMFVFINIGPIGLVSLLAAKAMGASQVIISGKSCIQCYVKGNYICIKCLSIYLFEIYPLISLPRLKRSG